MIFPLHQLGSLTSAPLTWFISHIESESRIERGRGIESAATCHLDHLHLRIIPKNLHRIGNPVVIDKLAEITPSVETDRPGYIKLVGKDNLHNIIDRKFVIQIGLILFKIAEHAFIYVGIKLIGPRTVCS